MRVCVCGCISPASGYRSRQSHSATALRQHTWTAAERRLALVFHPDKNAGQNEEEAPGRDQNVVGAWCTYRYIIYINTIYNFRIHSTSIYPSVCLCTCSRLQGGWKIQVFGSGVGLAL